jgi:Ca-activated chloride channel family protein
MPTGAAVNVQMPLNLSLVLDHSGSMSGEKLRDMKEAVKLVLDRMQPWDIVSVVVFDDKVQVVAPSQAASNPGYLKSLVDGMQDGGGTEMSRGMKAGLAELKKAVDPARVSRMILLTDGQTYGDEKTCQQLATQAGAQKIPITALGLGDDWNEELLDSVANACGGASDQIESPQEIQTHFQATLGSMQATVVSNAQLVLRLVAGVTPKQVWRVVPLITQLDQRALSDRDVQVDLGDLEKDTGQGILIELLLPSRPAGRYRIGQAELDYDIPALRIQGEKVRADILMTFTADPAQGQIYDPRVMKLIETVSAHKLQTRALDDAKAGNVAGATQKLRAAATRLLDLGQGDLAAAAQAEAQRLEQGQGMSAAGTKKLQYGTRKLTQRLDDH